MKRSLSSIALLLFAVASSTTQRATAQVALEQDELLASDAALGDQLGVAVDLFADRALTGAWLSDAPGMDGGAAYVWRRTGSIWSEETRLDAFDGAAGDHLGAAVALGANVALVGAPAGDAPGPIASAGAVYVFDLVVGAWVPGAKLGASDAQAGDAFGSALALDEDTLLVGAPYDSNANGVDAGAAYVFVRSGATWTQQAKLTPLGGSANALFGDRGLAVDGDVAIVGA